MILCNYRFNYYSVFLPPSGTFIFGELFLLALEVFILDCSLLLLFPVVETLLV